MLILPVGTDDETVAVYNSYLRIMAATIFQPGELSFAGLQDLLDLHSHSNARLVAPENVQNSPFGSRGTWGAEVGRRALMSIFAQSGSLDNRLRSDTALLGLCRG